MTTYVCLVRLAPTVLCSPGPQWSRCPAGVVHSSAPVLVGLYEEPERPPNAVDYIKKYLGAPVGVDIDALRAENDRLKGENRNLHQTVEELNKRVCSRRSRASQLMYSSLDNVIPLISWMFLTVMCVGCS